MPLLLALSGMITWTNPVWTLVGPAVAMTFLLFTGGLLVWDLDHPERFWMVLTRPQWRSWLVRGGFIITGYGGILALHMGAVIGGQPNIPQSLAWAGGPLAAMTAIYTAYLFAQAKARDLWQSPLLPAHLLVQALLAGSAALILLNLDELTVGARWILQASLALHLILALGEVSMAHPTAHATLAARNMTRGAYAAFYWAGIGLTAASLLLVGTSIGIGALAGALAGLVGLLLYEHAYVQAGQSVPLA